jgi:hypothetical protein
LGIPIKHNFDAYNWGAGALVDESCEQMAAYVARIVEHYTRGGHHDECGHWHPSGFYYNWSVLSVLNENEHNIGGPRYVTCFDAWRRAVSKVNSEIKLAGPETVIWAGGLNYLPLFLDPKNHNGSQAPELVTTHWAIFEGGGTSGEGYFTGFDSLMATIEDLVAQRDTLSPTTELALNEFIPFNNDWCDVSDSEALFAQHGATLAQDPRSRRSPRSGGCPNWKDNKTAGVRINRKTLGWNAAAACFAYGYARLALVGYKYVGADQLIGGPW